MQSMVLLIMSTVPTHHHSCNNHNNEHYNRGTQCNIPHNHYSAMLSSTLQHHARRLARGMRQLVLQWLPRVPIHNQHNKCQHNNHIHKFHR